MKAAKVAKESREALTGLGYGLESLHRAKAVAITMIAPVCHAKRSSLEPRVKYSPKHTRAAIAQITRHRVPFGCHIGYSVFHKPQWIEKDTPSFREKPSSQGYDSEADPTAR